MTLKTEATVAAARRAVCTKLKKVSSLSRPEERLSRVPWSVLMKANVDTLVASCSSEVEGSIKMLFLASTITETAETMELH